MNDGISLADIKAVTDDNGFGGGGALWVVLLFLIAAGNGGFGMFGNRNDGALNTDFAVIERKLDSISNGLCDGFFALNNSVKDGFYSNARDIQTVAAQNQQCCCETNRNIDAVRYEAAQNTAAINENINAQVQRVLDKMCADRTADLQDRNWQLRLDAALGNVVRYPSATTYTAGYNPCYSGMYNAQCGCGCC